MAIVGIAFSRPPDVLSSTQFALSSPASCHSLVSRDSAHAACASKERKESELFAAHSVSSCPSITREALPFSRRQRQRLLSVTTSASIGESPRTAFEEQSGLEISKDQQIFYNSLFQSVTDAKKCHLEWGHLTSMVVVMSSPMITFPAFAGAGMTDEEWVQFWIAWVVIAVVYLLVIPLLLYNYLRLRWYKRKMFEAILQFGLVFLFFPGLLLLAPFINFRPLPRNNAKEPWDDPRSLL